jgi:hypothetical protein
MGGWQILKIGLTGGNWGARLASRLSPTGPEASAVESGLDLACLSRVIFGQPCDLAHSSRTTQLHQTPNATIIEAIGEGVSPTLLVNLSRTRCILYDHESIQATAAAWTLRAIYEYPLRRRFYGL